MHLTLILTQFSNNLLLNVYVPYLRNSWKTWESFAFPCECVKKISCIMILHATIMQCFYSGPTYIATKCLHLWNTLHILYKVYEHEQTHLLHWNFCLIFAEFFFSVPLSFIFFLLHSLTCFYKIFFCRIKKEYYR